MKAFSAISAGIGLVLMVTSSTGMDAPQWALETTNSSDPATVVTGSPAVDSNDIVQEYCVRCHNDRRLSGNMSLETFDALNPEDDAEAAERMIRKLRVGMMPPPGAQRPAGDTLETLMEDLEARIDAAAADNPNPGGRTFQRLNQAEYAASILDLLGLEIDPGAYLPLDTKSENFDNIADVQLLSPTLLGAYLNAAAEISRLVLGDVNATSRELTYTVSGYTSQRERVPGAPFGTRGGVSVPHTFPADGEYVFSVVFRHTTTGLGFYGQITRYEQVEISIDGVREALLDVDQWMEIADPDGLGMRTEPIFVSAGPHRVTAAFIEQSEGPAEDLVSPHDWSSADRHTGMSGYGLTLLPHLQDLSIGGPYNVTGVSESSTRANIFSCRPASPDEALPCAEEILTRLGTKAYRRPLNPRDLEALMAFYAEGAEDGFERGIRTALTALLASPHFVFRMEEAPAGIGPGESYRISDSDLASRLSFFLWGTPPDDELVSVATRGDLSDPDEFQSQVRRMLEDPRSEALGSRFAGQWLRLQDLDKVHPDSFWFPDFDQQLADAMRHETELFFNNLVREDLSLMDMYEADYTFVNERLADHYGIPGVSGNDFRKVSYPDDRRRGVLGHGSVLTLTSNANRTSPVLRGKWVMEVLLGSPPPAPPPGVPALDETDGSDDGRFLTTRERMALHRASPSCNSCHRFMDPIGLALDNFDVTGRWRIRENGAPVDTRGELYDGTPISGPADLQRALVQRPVPMVRTFTENLMAFALGRRVEYFDQPTVRAVTQAAAADGYRVSSLIMGIVSSDAFQMQRVDVVADDPAQQDRQ